MTTSSEHMPRNFVTHQELWFYTMQLIEWDAEKQLRVQEVRKTVGEEDEQFKYSYQNTNYLPTLIRNYNCQS